MPISERSFKQCIKGNRKAQQKLFIAYKSRLMGICRRYSSCKEEAEDILQESFIKIFSRLKSVEAYRYLDRWMIKTTINTAINYYYKNRKHLMNVGYEEINEFDDDDISILDQMSNEHLITIINELPDGYRIVFNLYVIEGYKHHEIAKLLDISENTSKSQLSRAKGLLREQLKGLGIKKFENYG